MTHNKIKSGLALAKNLRAEGQTSRAEYVEELIQECLKLRQGLLDVIKICGSDCDECEVPEAYILNIVKFAKESVQSLRNNHDI